MLRRGLLLLGLMLVLTASAAQAGKDVHLEGSFMGAMTQHHKAPIAMQVTEAGEI